MTDPDTRPGDTGQQHDPDTWHCSREPICIVPNIVQSHDQSVVLDANDEFPWHKRDLNYDEANSHMKESSRITPNINLNILLNLTFSDSRKYARDI